MRVSKSGGGSKGGVSGLGERLAIEPGKKPLEIESNCRSNLLQLGSNKVSVQAQILNLMRDLQAEFGLSYLFISHDMAVIRYMADRIAVMYVGKLVEYAARDELLAQPAHPYTEALMSAVPHVTTHGRRGRIVLEGAPP